MGVSVWVGDNVYEIGASSFLNSFFSTVYVTLENERWGSRFPIIMRQLYSGKMTHTQSETAINELQSIRALFGERAPGDLVWDFEDREAVPPGEPKVSSDVNSLADAFITSDGRDLFDVLLEAFAEAMHQRLDVVIT